MSLTDLAVISRSNGQDLKSHGIMKNKHSSNIGFPWLIPCCIGFAKNSISLLLRLHPFLSQYFCSRLLYEECDISHKHGFSSNKSINFSISSFYFIYFGHYYGFMLLLLLIVVAVKTHLREVLIMMKIKTRICVRTFECW